MRWLHGLLALGLVLGLSANGEAAKKAKGQVGIIEAVNKGSENSGTITVKVGAKKKQNTTGTELKVQVASSTKIEMVTITKKQKGQKPETSSKPATFADLNKGTRVRVIAAGENQPASEIQILARAKK